MSHTPGPWHTGGVGNPFTDPRYSIWGPTPAGMQSGEWIAKDVKLGNAHLIAAAPEMLVALKFAEEIIRDQAERFHQDCRCQLCESGLDLIQEAIAKAEPQPANKQSKEQV